MQDFAMLPNPEDTIVALSSAPGQGLRAIIRLTGSQALRIALTLFQSATEVAPNKRRRYDGALRLPGLYSQLPADLYVAPAPRTYTGQELVEIHTISSPPLVELLIATLLSAGARAAQPGEFTLRAFLAGKLDLPRAEAVLGVIEATDRDQLRDSLAQLAGGVTRPLDGLRDDLINLLADVEAGLDFVDEDISFVGREDLLTRLAKGLAQLTLVRKQLEGRGRSDRPFRAVLVGRPNAGKSSLYNALTGATTNAGAIVSPVPGTTRDYLVHRLDLGGVAVELVDTAGRQTARDAIDAQSQELGRDVARRADLLLVCIPADAEPDAAEQELLDQSSAVAVATQCDLAIPPLGRLATSAVTGQGLDDLRELLAERAQAKREPPLAPSLSRCRHHVEACLEHLRKAHNIVLFDDPPEVLALELRGALEELGAIVGAVYTDDLLDRIFSRFCIGK
jgi:tRNA modification GTPase